MNRTVYLSIGLLSASLIAFQLVLMQLLSISQWNHFAFMVISVALLGVGASGTVLTFFKSYLAERIEISLPVLMMLTSASMGLIMLLGKWVFGGFDAYLLFLGKGHYLKLVLSYLALFVPFLLGSTAIGLVYAHYVSTIGKLYFADLLGAGLGGLLMLYLFWHVEPALLPFVIAILPLGAGLLLVGQMDTRNYLLLFMAAASVVAIGILAPPALPMSQYKSLSRTLLLPEATILEREISPYGELKLLQAPALRYAPGLSLTYTGKIPVEQVLFNNGDWFGPLVDLHQGDSHFLDFATNALPFVMATPETVLVPDAGTGLFVAHALSHHVRSVVAVEPNQAAVDLVKRHVAFPAERVRYVSMDSRHFLASTKSNFDLIYLPVLESFGGTCGIHAVQEQYLFTVQAFISMWKHLSDNGMIAVTVWMDFPPRNSLKMLATLVETASKLALDSPDHHLLAIRSWGTLTFVLKKSPVTKAEIDRLNDFCRLRQFDPLIAPGLTIQERSKYNQLQDNRFFRMTDQLMTGDREALYRDYDFQIRPATDNKPYFSQFLKISRLSTLKETVGVSSLPFLEVGYLIVLITFVQITLIALLLIIFPLFFKGFRGRGKAYSLVHFAGIGIGYMFVEICLIQQFTLFFGHPVYAATAVLSGMLVFSGLGAFASGTCLFSQRRLISTLIAIGMLIWLLSVSLTPLLRLAVSLPMLLKIGWSLLIIGPLAFLMGMPFPTGLRLLSNKNGTLIPWAWGINGCFSVISTALASIIAVQAGFFFVMLIAGLAYLLTVPVNLKMTFPDGTKDLPESYPEGE
ncbi:MAG: spermidine synthase-like protein [Bacteroidota bacterium]|nr:spermidine synthase-like protein [Bacteroidota bacterium]